MRIRHLVVALMVAMLSMVACGGKGPLAPSPAPPVVVVPPVPTPIQTGITFIPLGSEADGMDTSELPIWGLRGLNTTSLVREMVFGDDSVPWNAGLHPLRRPAGAVVWSVPSALEGRMNLFHAFADAWGDTLTSDSSAFSFAIGDTHIGNEEFPAIMGRTYDNIGAIVGSLVVFRSVEDVTLYVVLHEGGHAHGMDHHSGFGVLGRSFDPLSIGYSVAEWDNAMLMRRVPIGTACPGMSSVRALRSSGLTTEVIR